MKLLRTFIFVLLFAVTVTIYLYQTRLAKQALTNVPDEVDRKVVITPGDAVSGIELRDHVRKTRIVLRKEKELWRLEVPVRYPTEGPVAEGIAIAGKMASRQPRLRSEKEWDEYGLAKPEIEVAFELPRAKTATLLLGATAPVGKAIFARWAEERGYFLLPQELRTVFQQSVYGLREKRIFRMPAEMFRKISIDMGEHRYEWKKDGPDWYWFEPVSKFGKKMPEAKMNLALQALQGLYVREFQDNNTKSKAALGFYMIHDRIRIGSEGGKTETLHFGDEVPDRNAYYGWIEGENTVFFVDRAKVIQLLDLLKFVAREEGGGPPPVELTKQVGSAGPSSDFRKPRSVS